MRVHATIRAAAVVAVFTLGLAGPAAALEVGQKAPDFTLPNAAGQPVRLADLVARGPVVLSFYRGRW